jgi:hypothetical protein
VVCVECDLFQSIGTVIYLAYRRLARHAQLPRTGDWSLVYRGVVLVDSEPVSIVFQDATSLPTVFLRREFPAPEKCDIPIFGGTIARALARTRSRGVPDFAAAIMERVEQRRDTEGIYRKSGLQRNIDSIQEHVERTVDQQAIAAFLDTQGAHDLACTLKLFIRTLAIPVVPTEMVAEFKGTLAIPDLGHSLQYLKVLVTCLPTPHYALLRALCEHLEVVVGGNNQMNYGNLALVLGGNFFRATGDVVSDTGIFQNIAQHIFQHWRFIFLSEPMDVTQVDVVTLNDVNLPMGVIGKGQRLSRVDLFPFGQSPIAQGNSSMR